MTTSPHASAPTSSGARPLPPRPGRGRAWCVLALLTLGLWPAAGQWTQVANNGPSARYYTSMAEAPDLGQTILFGGHTGAALLGDTWNWNGSAWQSLSPTNPKPSARFTHGLAHLADGATRQVVLFGGIGAGNQTLGDTWVWEGANWRQITGNGPPTRFVVSMASETSRGRVLLFGGFSGATYLGDTWGWNGTSWTQLATTGPSPRGGHAMAYDVQRDRVVLFGGETAPGTLSGQTWEWDGTNWSLVSTSGPAPRREHAMSYRGGRVVLFGGISQAQDALGDTWEWNGSVWVKTLEGCPPARFAHTMTTERATGTVLLYGGANTNIFGDTWRYSGGLIATSPSSQTVVAGQSAVFLVQVQPGGGAATYQWEKDCGNGFAAIPGATGSTHTINTATQNDACQYRCVVTVGGCSATSAAAQLTVLPPDSGPVITRQPVSVTVAPGQPASFSVTAVGAPPLSYQWYHNGNAMPGFTIQELDLGPAGPADAGTYTVEVSNPHGFVTSDPATLTFGVEGMPDQWNVWVEDPASLGQVQQQVVALGGTVREASLYFLRVSFASPEVVFQQVASLPGVRRAEAAQTPGLLNYNSRNAINTIKVQAAPYGFGVPGLTGLGVVAGVWDGGTFGLTHPDYFSRLTVMENCPPNSGNDTHAAHVIGTMAGDGSYWFNSLAGMAPQATIKDWSFLWCPGPTAAPTPQTEMLNARNLGLSGWPAPRIDYSQNSWGYVPTTCALYGAYVGDCADFDKLVRQEALPIFFAAGNSQNGLTSSMTPCGSPFGTVLPLGTSKNVVTVGAIDMQDTITVFSSCGPTADGRLKPDVMAMGLGVYSTTDPSWQGFGYFALSGTSMATPAVSGTAALLLQQFSNLTLPAPSPALLKAILCNTTTDLGNAGPDFKYGYGKVNAEKAVATIVGGQFHDEVINTAGVGGLGTGGVWTKPIPVTQGCDLRVTLAWSDKEFLGTNWSAPTLINDLDLELVDPSSGIHLPLTLTPGTPNALAIPAVNRRDNVEQVVISGAQGGTWTLVVKGFNVPAGPQEFAVTWCVVCPPPCQPQPIAGLWNTGYDTNGNVLASGAIDPHYKLISQPATFTDARHNYFGPPWLPDGLSSWWLQPGPPGYAPNGTYIYELEFDLGNCDPNTASITGRWAADDWAELRINNVPVPGVNAAYGFSAWSPLAVSTGFVPGLNKLQFVVKNIGGGPTGLRVELSGTVCCHPCVTPPSGMVAWWPLDEPTAAPVVNETVAGMNGNVLPGPLGSPFAPLAIPGKVAGAMRAIHPAGYAQVPPFPALDIAQADFTIDAWIAPVLCNTNALYPIVDKLDVGNPLDGYALYIAGGRLTLSLGDPNFGGQVFTAPQPLNYNAWNFIAVIVDYVNAAVTFYVNGVAQPAIGLPPFPAGPTPSTLWIGGSRLFNPATLHCEIGIDELEFFQRALNPTNDLAPIFHADSAGKCKNPCQGGYQCAPDKTVKCDAQWSFDPPTSTIPGCQLQPISVSTATNLLAPCGVQYVRTWTFVDCCGLVSTCTQSVTALDTTPPVVHCPTNKAIECGSQWSFDVPTAVDDCCGTNVTITVLNTFTNVPGPCVQFIRRTWQITDCCQNSTTCSQTITVADTVPPALACATNRTVECGSQWAFDPPTVWDACCGSNVTVTVLGTSTNGNGPCSLAIIRTWQATDCCNNSAVCSQTVTVVDATPPVFATTCVTNVLAAGTTTDNFVGPEPASPSAGLAIRMAAAGLPLKGFDDCTINRGVAHTFLMPPGCVITSARLTVRLRACGSQCDNDALGLSFTDASGTLLPGSWSRYLGAGNPSAGLFPGNWCTNSTGATLVLDLAALPLAPSGTVDLLPNLNANGFLDFTLQDDSAVDFLSLDIVTCCCAPDKTVSCGSQWTFDTPTALDACCGTNVTVNPISTVTNVLAPCTLLITRTWEARDCCGNKAICSQTVTVIDTTPPVINCAALQALPITVTNACDGVIPDFCLPQYYSDLCCGISNCVQVPPAGTLVGPGTHPVTNTVTDLAGNSATCVINFTVVAPTQSRVWNTGTTGATAAPFTLVAAPAPIGTPTPAVVTTVPGAWLPNSVQSRWVSFTNSSSSAPPGVYVYRLTFDLPCTNGARITGRFLADDNSRIFLNGSSTPFISGSYTVWSNLNLTSGFSVGANYLDIYVTNAIIWTGFRAELTNTFTCCCPNALVLVCSSNKTVQCGSQWTFDPPSLVSTNCGGATPPVIAVISTVTNVTGNCSQTITRTWQATDCCGNTGTCSQIVTVVDTTPPVITCASNRTVECGAQWSFTPPTAYDACCGAQLTLGVVSTTTNGVCPQYITRTWVATDCCGNKATCSQTIRIVDTTPPVFTYCPPSFSVPAGQPWTFGTPTATDTCCGPSIITLATTTNPTGPCLITYTRYWRARDCCGNYSTAICSQSVTVQTGIVPPNDECVAAIPLTLNAPYLCGSNLCATPTPAGILASTPCGWSVNSPDVWYTVTPVCSGLLTVDTCSACSGRPTFDTVLSAYTGPCSGPLVQVPAVWPQVSCNDDACGLQSRITFPVVAGQTYRIRVAGFNNAVGSFAIRATMTINPPPNDLCVNAIPVTVGNPAACGTTLCGATPTPAGTLVPAPCGGSLNSPDVWYRFTPACSGPVTMTTCFTCPPSGTFDTVLSVYTGNCGGPLNQVAGGCNDDAPAGPCIGTLQSYVQFNATAGVTYYVRIAGFVGQTGDFRLNINQTVTPPANDLCVNATPITAGTYAWNNCGANTDGPTNSSCVPQRDVWFSYTAPCSGLVQLSTCGSAIDTSLAVYFGPCTALNLMTCNDNAVLGPCNGSQQSFVLLNVTAGQTYRIRVGGAGAATGSGVLNLTGPVPPANTCGSGTSVSCRLYRIIGNGNGTAWAWSLSSPCCANLQNLNVPGVVGPASAVAQQFANSINAVCPGTASTFTIFGNTYLMVCLRCGPNAAVNLAVGPAGTPPQNLCLVTGTWLPTSGPCSFNPDIVEEPLSGQDANQNGTDDYLDILAGTSADRNGNGIPDEAEDCFAPELLSKPESVLAEPGVAAVLSVEAAGTPPFGYQWLRDGVPVSDGPNVSGATSKVLTITPVTAADLGHYTVIVSNHCGTVSSATVEVAAPTLTLPVIYDASLTEGWFRFTVDTKIGFNYLIEYKDELGDGPWQPLTRVPGIGAPQLIFDSEPPPTHRFYRVLQEVAP
jgi:hypothetical protein